MQTIYFLSAGIEIKIGITKDLRSRIADLQRERGCKLSLLGTIEGDRHLERSIHKALRQHCIGGEWFRDCRDVRAHIQHCLNHFQQPGTVERNNVLADIARVLWPRKTAAHIAALARCSERGAESYLSGDHSWSGQAISAVLGEILARHQSIQSK